MNVNENTPLASQLVAQPRLWQLSLRITPDAVQAAAFSPAIDNSLIYRDFPTHGTTVQNVVYDNPLLTSDFGRVNILVHTPRTIFVPGGLEDPRDIEALARRAYPGQELRTILNPLPQHNANALLALDRQLWAFLSRTYPQSTPQSSLALLCRYADSRANTSSGTRMLAVFRKGELDLVATRSHALLLANTYKYQNHDDAAYYLLATRRALQIPDHDELLLAGDPALRPPVATLRRFMPRTIPSVFPPELFRLGTQSLRVPIDMLVPMILP